MIGKGNSSYSASFTVGSLLHRETSVLLPLLQSEHAESLIREEIKTNKLLHVNSESARKRIIFEIIKRTKSVEQSIWGLFANLTEEEQKVLLFYICLKTYNLIFDFHFNVTVKQWYSSSQIIEPYFYQMELEEIAIRDEQVDKWTDTTKHKTISVYLLMLKEIKMLNNSSLRPIKLGEAFWHFFVKHGELWFLDACLLGGDEKERIVNL